MLNFTVFLVVPRMTYKLYVTNSSNGLINGRCE